MSGSESTRIRNALRSSIWSSASSTLMVMRSPPSRRPAGHVGSPSCRPLRTGREQREGDPYLEAAGGAGARDDRAAQREDPLAHADQAVAAAALRRVVRPLRRQAVRPAAVVLDGHRQRGLGADDPYRGAGPGAGVLVDVGERLLDDPVGGE